MKREVSKDSDHLKVILKNALSTSATANFKELLRVVRGGDDGTNGSRAS